MKKILTLLLVSTSFLVAQDCAELKNKISEKFGHIIQLETSSDYNPEVRRRKDERAQKLTNQLHQLQDEYSQHCK